MWVVLKPMEANLCLTGCDDILSCREIEVWFTKETKVSTDDVERTAFVMTRGELLHADIDASDCL